MQDEDILALIRRLGYQEGLPVVTDPGILNPKDFLAEVLEQRLPNPFMPDAPQRIATDTSQKVGIRFGETIKSWIATGRDLTQLKAIPLALAGWLRYLLAVDDEGKPFEVSADPLKEELQSRLAGIRLGEPESCRGQAAAHPGQRVHLWPGPDPNAPGRADRGPVPPGAGRPRGRARHPAPHPGAGVRAHPGHFPAHGCPPCHDT